MSNAINDRMVVGSDSISALGAALGLSIARAIDFEDLDFWGVFGAENECGVHGDGYRFGVGVSAGHLAFVPFTNCGIDCVLLGVVMPLDDCWAGGSAVGACHVVLFLVGIVLA